MTGVMTLPKLDAGTTTTANTATTALKPTLPKPLLPTIKGTTNTKPPLPPSITHAAAQAPKTPAPVYSGPHINSIPHVASQLGGMYAYNSATNTHTVNGQPIQPTSVVNGTPHAPVAQVAQAAGYPSSSVQTTATGVQVMPHASTPTAPPAQNTQWKQDANTYGTYWADVLQKGAVRDPKAAGETLQQSIQHEAQMYGIDPSQVQVKNGMTWVDPKYVRAYLDNQAAQAKAQQAQQQQQSFDPFSQLASIQQQYLGQIMGSAPQAPQLQQIPTLDMSQIQPFQWDATQDFMNQYQAQLPAFQQQLAAEDQKINDEMNKRGLYNSGIAQQNVDMQNQALYGKLFDSIQKQSLADQKQAFTEYQGQISNYLNAYKANVDAMYKNGQLSDQQYADAINEWGKQVSALQAAMQQQASLNQALLPYTMGPTPAQMLPYQYPTANTLVPYIYGPTPYQQQTLDLNSLKALLPYQMPTAYQQGQLSIDQQKLQAQIAQNAVADQQKWAQIMGVGPDGQPTLDAQKLQEQIAKDAQAAQTAAANASNNQVRTQVTALHDQLVAAGQIITNLTNQGVKATDPQMQQAIQNYNTINAEISAIANGLGGNSPN